MDLNEYQGRAAETAIYPGKRSTEGLTYTALGLAGEAGEMCNKIKKVLRDDGGELAFEKMLELQKELGDVLWYVAMMADELSVPLGTVAANNLEKLAGRATRGALSGSGDNR